MDKEIIRTIGYFGQFSYAPSDEEVYRFVRTQATYKKLQMSLDGLVKKKIIVQLRKKIGTTASKYTLPEYAISLNDITEKERLSAKKEAKIGTFVNILSNFAQFKLIGLSGSVAMRNADNGADIDIFIITEAGSMWTARFLANVAAAAMGLRRGRGSHNTRDKICLNMFMDESDLRVPKTKQTEFVAHEILQMRTIYDTTATHEKFLHKNKWIYTFFPNATLTSSHKKTKQPYSSGQDISQRLGISIRLEKFLRRVQLWLINRHKTTEIVTDTQLWFFPDDYEKKIRDGEA